MNEDEHRLPMYTVELAGHLKVTAHVVAGSLQRAVEIAWSGELAEGESVEYQQSMQCFDPDGPKVERAYLGADA